MIRVHSVEGKSGRVVLVGEFSMQQRKHKPTQSCKRQFELDGTRLLSRQKRMASDVVLLRGKENEVDGREFVPRGS